MKKQLERILRKVFDDGMNAQYRMDRKIITYADSEDKKTEDVAWGFRTNRQARHLITN